MFEVEEWLHSRIGLNFRSGLGRIQQAVDLLGNPEKSYPIIHVTGTNGKLAPLPLLISSASMIESVSMGNRSQMKTLSV